MLELLFVVAQKCVLWYIINEKGQPPTRWVARLVKMEIPPTHSSKFWGGFSMLELLFVVQGYDERK